MQPLFRRIFVRRLSSRDASWRGDVRDELLVAGLKRSMVCVDSAKQREILQLAIVAARPCRSAHTRLLWLAQDEPSDEEGLDESAGMFPVSYRT
eukprot:3268378-Rhodomonas_salina.1